MEQRRFVIPIFVLTAVVIATLVFLKKPEPAIEEVILPVRVATLSGDRPTETLQISGTTRSAETAVLRFQIGGRVTKKQVRLGDLVTKGQTLAALYNPEIEPQLQQAKDNLARLNTEVGQAKRDYARVDALYKDQAVTRQEWENAKTRLSTSKQAAAAARASLDRASQVNQELNLVAPFSGSVTEVMLDLGEVIAAGAPAMRLSNPNGVELSLAVSDKILKQVSLGQSVSVQPSLDPEANKIIGTITEISPYRERGSLPEIIISLESDEVAPGVAVNAFVDVTSERGLALPIRSVLMTGNNTVGVYRVVEDRATLVAIRPLRINSDNVVIDMGLEAGDTVVTEGISQLFDGAKIQVVQGAN